MTNTDTTTTDQTTAPADETPSPDDVFASAFADFASPGDKTDGPDVAAPVTHDETEAPADAAPEAAPAEPPAGETPEPAPVDASGQNEPPRLTAEEWQAQYNAMLAQQQAAYQQQAQYAQQAEAPPPPLLGQEEVAALQEFQKEWPDVAKAMELQQRVLAHQVIDYVFKEIAKEVTPKLQQLDDVAERAHFEDIYSYVPDYDDVRDRVIQWVQQQPVMAQRAYVPVVQQGTPDQIAWLVDEWRSRTGQQQAPQPVAPTPQYQQPQTYQYQQPAAQTRQPSQAVRQAAAALAPVSSKRSAVIRTDDPNDFDGAFERFAQHRL